MAVDYTKFTTNGAPPGSVTAVNKRWWALKGGERTNAALSIAKLLGQNDTKRQTQYQISSRLYGNSNLMGINGLSYSKVASVQNALKDRISYNIVQSAIDTVTAKIAKNKPKPMFLTSGGDYKLQKQAKKLEKFTDGIMYENKTHDKAVEAFVQACVTGDGFIHVFEQNGRVCHEPVWAGELYVDWAESFYGYPRQLHWVKSVDRAVLLDSFPKARKVIENTSSATADLTGSYQNVADQITVCESFHLPSGPDADDGIHLIMTEAGELFSEPWTKAYFPFAHFRWSKRMFGWWGQGAAEQVQNIQVELNKLLWVVQRSYHLGGSFKVFLENGSKIVKEHLSNEIGSIVNYTGTKPEYVVPPIVPPEYYQWIQSLKQSAYEQLGVSMLSAASQKPAGLNSGKALREYNDIETERFMMVGQAWEQFHIDISTMSIDLARDIFKRDKNYKVKAPNKRRFVDEIDWADVDLDADSYFMQVYPVSSLPDEPSGRLQTIQEYMQAGLVKPRTGRKLLDFPDLEAVEDKQNAPEDYITEILDKLVEDGTYTPPEPYDDLNLAQELALEYYANGKCSGLEEEKLEMLRTFTDQVNMLKAKAAQAMAPQGGAVSPQAQAQPPPQSDMIPNVQGVPAA